MRGLLVLAGIVLGQFVLYGPSLIGQKVLLPLDLLAGKEFYIPRTPEIATIQPKDGSVSDLVFLLEPARRFAVSELHAGRFPMWAPYQFAGAPYQVPLFSPFFALQTSVASPVVLAWSQMLVALVAGFGAYLLFRVGLRLSFWPAAICAWCYPLTAFFVLWQGFPITHCVAWLPWLFLAVDRTVRRAEGLSLIGLALVTCLVLNGQLDVAAQVLLASGLYGVWCLYEVSQESSLRHIRGALLRLSAGWMLGFLLAAPFVLPVLDYLPTGARMAQRAAGAEERPPVGLTALPQVVLPDLYGTRQPPSARYAGGPIQQESSTAGYAGLLATLVAAPLAFCSRRHRRLNILWMALLVFGLGWCLNIPGVVGLLRLPVLRMMSHDRLVFMACFAALALAATGLEVLLREPVRWHGWMWLPLGLLAGLCCWCVYRTAQIPEPIARLTAVVSGGARAGWIQDLDGARQAQAWFVRYYSSAAILSGLGVLCWVLLRTGKFRHPAMVTALGVLQAGELLRFGYGRNAQCDWALYYPSVPVLQALAGAPGRVMGYGCLPATLSATCGLRDIRGYDGVNPARLVELVLSAGDPLSIKPPYAPTMELAPKATVTPEGDIRLPPVLDMLGVRYVIFRGAPVPNSHPRFQSFDYWALENPRALPRAFVPERVEVVSNEAERVRRIESPEFAPRAVAYVESPLQLPERCRGSAQLVDEVPTRVRLSALMETSGLLVLADLWDKGWRAYLDGRSAPILRANHAVRGVVLPPGEHQVEFRYEPAGFVWGLALAGLSGLILMGRLLFHLRGQRKRRPHTRAALSPWQELATVRSSLTRSSQSMAD
jgi:hypothetical protein